ncbi:MAG TPA: hypothetical protein VKW06_17585 [Candidatus Angelobacter sp.]|nr:hypothetical protein [Candidatus Angelobacter sp.]
MLDTELKEQLAKRAARPHGKGNRNRPAQGAAESTIPEDLFLKAARQRRKLLRSQRGNGPGPLPPAPPGALNWTPLGPSSQAFSYATGSPPVSGRVNGIAVGPSGTRVYAGAADGGVWFSGDSGVTWTPLEDQEVSPSYTSGLDADALSVGSIAVQFGASAATDIIYDATGEAYRGIGIKVSTQGGALGTWTLEATNLAGTAASKIVIDPDNPAKAFAANSAGLWQRPSNNFTTWLPPANTAVFTGLYGACDLVIAGSTATNNKKYYAAFENDRIYVSTDFNTWSVVPGFPALNGSNSFAIRLAASESDPNTVYALVDDGRLFRLVAGTFQLVPGMPMAALFPGGQGIGDSFVAVDPSNPSTVYLGGDRTNGVEAALFKGTLTGGPGTYAFPFNAANTNNPANDPTWIGLGVHADMHSFAFAWNAGQTAHDPSNVWVGCDGGIWNSTGSGAKGTFVSRNTGLATLLLHHFAQRPDMDSVIFGGGMDNGTFRLWSEQAGRQVQGGDGGGVAIDPNNPYQVMCYENGALIRSTDGGVNNWSNANFPPQGNNQEYKSAECPIATTPPGKGATICCYGTNRLWMTPDWGNNWVTLPTNTNPYAGPPNLAQDALDGPVYWIAVASPALIFVATLKTVYRYDLSAGNWSKTTISMAGLPANYQNWAMAVDQAAAGSLYLVLQDHGYDHVWYNSGTGNGNPGAGWVTAGLSKNTLDVPVWCVAVDPANPANPSAAMPQYLYIGSDVGVWKGTRTAANTWSWSIFSAGLPEATVQDLGIHAQARLLRAALWGRGVWEIPIDAASTANPDIYLRVNYADGGRRQAWVDGSPDPTSIGYNVYHWMSCDIKVYRSSLGPPQFIGLPGYVDFAFNIGDWIDSTAHVETADQSGMDRIFVEIHNRGYTPLAANSVRVCLLLTTVAGAVPLLPAGYANSINTGDISNWVQGTPWVFADPTKYKFNAGSLDVRTPQVVEFDVDFSQLGLPPGDHVCAAAFITTVNGQDQLSSPGNTNLDQLVMQDKHVAQRNLHLVASGVKPLAPPHRYPYFQPPVSFLMDFNNVEREEVVTDLVFQQTQFPGHLSFMLPKLPFQGGKPALQGIDLIQRNRLETAISDHLADWLGDVGEALEQAGERLEAAAARMARETRPSEIEETRRKRMAHLDHSRVYVAKPASVATIGGLRLAPGARITAAVTVQAPPDAKPGDRFRFDIIQKSGGKILGGSTYVFAVTKPRK